MGNNGQQGDEHDVKQLIYQLLSQSFIRLDSADHILMRRFGLTLTQSWALIHIGDPDGHSLSELAQLLICDKSNVTSVVDKLEEEGFAVRQRGKAGDRRYTRVVLTAKGYELRRAIITARTYMVEKRLQALTSSELTSLHESLQKLTDTLNQQFASDEETTIIEQAFEHSRAQSFSNTL